MRRTIYLSDDLAVRVDEYLKLHKDQTFSSLVQTVLEEKVVPKNRPSILDLIGFVSVEPDEIDKQFVDHPEDSVVARHRGPI